MTPGVYSAVSGMTARWTHQIQSAENISHAKHTGHKRQVVSFGAFGDVLRKAQGEIAGGTLATPLAYTRPLATDLSSGTAEKTGSNLDAAIKGTGFFALQTPDGVRLTRNGHFVVSKENTLVSEDGFPVLGTTGPGTTGPIKVPQGQEGKAALAADGSVNINDPTGGQSQTVGQLQILMPKDISQLRTESGSFFSAPETEPVASPELNVGMLEGSNVEMPKEMVGMINNQRVYEMLSKAFQAQDEGLQRAIQDLST
ncbi:MAG: flagellar hook basal-body protein [Planctomycetota bacterium]